jgi:hypothetical protein
VVDDFIAKTGDFTLIWVILNQFNGDDTNNGDETNNLPFQWG